MNRFIILSLSLLMGAGATVAAATAAGETSISKFDCNSIDKVVTRDEVAVDKTASADGAASLKLDASKPTTFKLFEVSVANVDNAKLLYKAKVKTKDVKGKVYLEMWCNVPGKGEFFSRGMDQVLSGTNDWSSNEIPFFLKKGQKCDRAKLNLVVDGTGTAWVDQVELAKAPL